MTFTVRDLRETPIGFWDGLSPEELHSVETWDRLYVDGSGIYASTQWPGIETGDNPWPPRPEVVRQCYDRPRNRSKSSPKTVIPEPLRWEVWERDNFTCLHCGVRRFLTIDHIHPESKGGELTLDNLQTLCRSCNSRKGARTQ
jgi:hypothetical protein